MKHFKQLVIALAIFGSALGLTAFAASNCCSDSPCCKQQEECCK